MMTGQTIVLRDLERRHLELTRSWANDPELMRLLDRAQPVEGAEHEQWFASIQTRSDCAYFAIETAAAARHIGNVWLWNIDSRHRRAELRIVIGSHADQGRGMGTEAISLACQYAFGALNLHKVYAYVLGINPRARHAFEKAGFELEGTLKEDRRVDDAYADVFILGKLRRA